jgi:hypothetical protein
MTNYEDADALRTIGFMYLGTDSMSKTSNIRDYRYIFSVILFSVTHLANSALPVGIPDPSGELPAAIMPNIPSSSDTIDGFPYDPININTPEWTGAVNQYYIDSSSSDCDDTANNGRGNETTPRCTLPGISRSSWTLNAGDQLFIVGDGAVYGDGQDINTANMMGTATDPIWIIGLGSILPELNFKRFFWQQGRHILFDSVHFRSTSDSFRMTWNNATGPVEYFTFRHIDCSGSEGTHSNSSRRCFSLGGTSSNINRFIVFYDVDVWGLGRWQDDRTTSRDMLGFQLQKWSRYVWLINSRVRHIQGDSIMCGNSNWWDFDHQSRPHYLYIGGNEFYENYENGYDQKGCYHVVVSENHIHDFYNTQKAANSTAIITEQDSEGHIGGRFTWFINNLVENTGTAFRASATTDDAYGYLIGNRIRNVDNAAFSFTQRCYSRENVRTCPMGLTFAQNTIDCSLKGTAITNVQNPTGSEQNVEIDGNIFYNCVDGSRGSPHNWESFSDEPLYLTHTNNVDFRTSGNPISFNLNRYDVFEENVINEDILLSIVNDSYELLPNSPAAGKVSQQNSAFDLFHTMYGLDIRKDYAGNTWNRGNTINAGAFQGGTNHNTIAPPSPPVLL